MTGSDSGQSRYRYRLVRVSSVPEAPEPQDRTSLLRVLLKDAGIAAGFLYFGGWIYLNRYYNEFQIDLSMMELGWHDILIHSAALLWHGFFMMLTFPNILILAVIPLIFYILPSLKRELAPFFSNIGDLNSRIVFPIFSAVLFLLAFIWLTSSAGAQIARNKWLDTARDRITFAWVDGKCITDPGLKERNDEGALRLLRATPKWYFVYVQDPDQTPDQLMPINVFHVPVACVASARLLVLPQIKFVSKGGAT